MPNPKLKVLDTNVSNTESVAYIVTSGTSPISIRDIEIRRDMRIGRRGFSVIRTGNTAILSGRGAEGGIGRITPQIATSSIED